MDRNSKIGVHCGSCFMRDHLEIPRAYAIAEQPCPRLYQAAADIFPGALSTLDRVRSMLDLQDLEADLHQILPSVLKEEQDRGRFREPALL